MLLLVLVLVVAVPVVGEGNKNFCCLKIKEQKESKRK